MRRIGIVLSIIIAVIVVAAAVFAATFNINRYRNNIQSELEQRLARKVTLGEMHLSIFPLRFGVQNLAITDDPAFASERPFIEAQQLDISVRPLPLLKGNVEIDSLDLRRPTIEFIKNERGIWNFSSLGGPSQSSDRRSQQPSPTESSEASPQGDHQFSLAKLSISDGRVAITDLQAEQPRTLYDHIDANVRNFAPNTPFSFDFTAHLPGSGLQEILLQGQAGPIVRDQPARSPLHGTFEMKRVELAGLQKLLNSSALASMNGTLSGRAEVSSESGTLAVRGKADVQNAQVTGRALGYPIAADYDLRDDLVTDIITIRNTTLTLGATPILVNGTVNAKPTPVQVELRMKVNNVSIRELARLASAFGSGVAPGATVSGNLSGEIQARGAAAKLALSGTISGNDVLISGKDIPQPVKVRSINLTLAPTDIRSDNFDLTSGGTTLVAQFALRQYLSKAPLIDATLRASNAALPEVLSMAKAYGVTALDKISGAGNLSMDMHATGPLETFSSPGITKTLNGTLALNLNSVRYTGIDVGYQLASIGGFLKPSEQDKGFTNISHVTGNVAVKNGLAQSNNLLAQLDIGNVGAAGTANLVTQALDLRLTAVLSKEFSQRVGGTGVSGYLNTALANNQGELVIPAIVTGTFQNPKFTPDLQKVAQMKLKGLLPNADNPLGGVAGVLGSLLGPKGAKQSQGQQPQQQQPSQPNPVQQLIDIFSGKKKQEQPSPPPK